MGIRNSSRFQFSLAGLLLLTAVVAVLAWGARYAGLSETTSFLIGAHLGIAVAGGVIFSFLTGRRGY